MEKKNIIRKAGVLNTKYTLKGKGMQRFIEKKKEKILYGVLIPKGRQEKKKAFHVYTCFI